MKQTTYIVTAIEHDDTDFVTTRKKDKEEKVSQQLAVGMAAEKPIGALCYLPKSIHKIAKRYAKDRDITVKRFFLESLLIGLEQQNVISHEQHIDVLRLPNEYGWQGRK